MPRGGARLGAGRPKGSGKARMPTLAQGVSVSPPDAATGMPALNVELEHKLPLAYMLDVMNDPSVDALRRDRMAIAAAPYKHGKSGEVGKKGERQSAASRVAAGKFAPAAAPRLVVNNSR